MLRECTNGTQVFARGACRAATRSYCSICSPSPRSHGARDAAGIVVGSSKVVRDITERRRTVDALQAANRRLQALSARLHETQEAERRRVAHELHDEICQALAAIKMNVQSVQKRAAAPQLAECLRIADAVLQRVRALSVDLRPPQLSELGLEAAVRAYVEGCARESGLDIDFRTNLNAARFDANFEAQCFRVVQEALHNAVRHAAARQAWIELVERGGELHLTVADDGTGFDVSVALEKAAAGEAAGIAAMLERVRLARGHIEIVSSPELGTEVRATWPLAAAGCAPV
jgi:two-component system sensor histidine kinase UhpB